MILIAYDGTESSDHAVDVAGALLGAGRAHILHVWQPFAARADVLRVTAVVGPETDEIDREEHHARGVAAAGADRARAARFEADGEAVQAIAFTAEIIEAAIDRLQPELVVIGSRGLTGLDALLKGSVSHHVSAHAHAPVLVVPPAPA